MNQVILLFTLLTFYAAIVSASSEYAAVLEDINSAYKESLTKITDEQRNDLNLFKSIVSKASGYNVENHTSKISDEALVKKVVKYLEQKVGSYPAGSERENKFLADCDKYLAEPCEKLRVTFRQSMALYFARYEDKAFVKLVKDNKGPYDQLETAGVCETILKATQSVCAKSATYFANHKSSFLGKIGFKRT